MAGGWIGEVASRTNPPGCRLAGRGVLGARHSPSDKTGTHRLSAVLFSLRLLGHVFELVTAALSVLPKHCASLRQIWIRPSNC
jgi:hypothetical protein